jgi:cold shock protein
LIRRLWTGTPVQGHVPGWADSVVGRVNNALPTHERRKNRVRKCLNGEKGFGFILRAGGADLFVHYSAIPADGYRSPDENQRVEFDVTQGHKGLQAANVRPV